MQITALSYLRVLQIRSIKPLFGPSSKNKKIHPEKKVLIFEKWNFLALIFQDAETLKNSLYFLKRKPFLYVLKRKLFLYFLKRKLFLYFLKRKLFLYFLKRKLLLYFLQRKLFSNFLKRKLYGYPPICLESSDWF